MIRKYSSYGYFMCSLCVVCLFLRLLTLLYVGKVGNGQHMFFVGAWYRGLPADYFDFSCFVETENREWLKFTSCFIYENSGQHDHTLGPCSSGQTVPLIGCFMAFFQPNHFSFERKVGSILNLSPCHVRGKKCRY